MPAVSHEELQVRVREGLDVFVCWATFVDRTPGLYGHRTDATSWTTLEEAHAEARAAVKRPRCRKAQVWKYEGDRPIVFLATYRQAGR